MFQNSCISSKSLKSILSQLNTSICKIVNSGKEGTGFLCKIIFQKTSETLNTLITSSKVIKENDISSEKEISIEFELKESPIKIKLDKTRKYYVNNKNNISIIELKENDDLNDVNYLEIDNNIFGDNIKKYVENKNIYLLFHSKKKYYFSPGMIKNLLKDQGISYSCETKLGCTGCPILNLDNYKVIGIHEGIGGNDMKNTNKVGYILNKSINEFISLNEKKEEQNEISKETFIVIFISNGEDYQIKGTEDMKLSQLISKFKEKSGLYDSGTVFLFDGYSLDAQSKQTLKELKIKNCSNILVYTQVLEKITFIYNGISYIIEATLDTTIDKLTNMFMIKNGIDKDLYYLYKGTILDISSGQTLEELGIEDETKIVVVDME